MVPAVLLLFFLHIVTFSGEGQKPVKITFGQLRKRVGAIASALRKAGVTVGDRVVGKILYNIHQFLSLNRFILHLVLTACICLGRLPTKLIAGSRSYVSCFQYRSNLELNFS